LTPKAILNTGSFAFTDLTNKSYSSSQSFGVSANLGLSDKANAADPAQSSTESILNSSTYSYQNQSSTSVDKTLATVGNGNLTIGGAQGSPDGLNRDADAINKELYSIDRTQGNIDLTVDHRLLSEDGRKAIVEDAKRTEILGEAIADLAKQSVSLTGSGEGEDSVRDHIGNKQDYFTATKNFTQSPENKEHVATLENPNATPEQKQAAYTALANAIATYMGVDPTEAKVLMEKDPEFAGYHSRDTGIVYINDREHGNASDAVNTVGHETQHYLDNQQNPNATQSQQYQSNREEYAGIMGNATADYLNFNFAQNNYALAGSNTHSIGGTSSEIERNLNLLLDNRVLLGQENPDSLDSCGPLCMARLQAVTPVTTSPAIPGVGQSDALNQNEAAALALERGLKDLAGTLGNLGSGGTAVATLTKTEVFGKQLDSFEVFDMLEVGQAYQMPDGNVVVKRGNTDVSLEQPGSALLNSYEMVTPTQLGQQGGFLAPDEPAVTALPNPAPINPGLIVLDNTPPEIPGQIGGFESGESLPSLTGTPVHEGHWSDSIYLSESGDTWRNPATNQIEPLPVGTKIHEDHIYPKKSIKQLREMDLLTPDEQRLILNDPDNLQLMPASLNCSKGCTVEGSDRPWNPSEKVVPGGLHPDYRNWLKDQQEASQQRLQDMINKLRNGE
jgi:hypothetical protein